MSESGSYGREAAPPETLRRDVVQLLAGLERQREELGPIADELIDLLRGRESSSHTSARYPA